ncbi:hypothetical protein D1007_56258 [Hordeum vulgare]|nr:hypothetical protein D1007_56258 [Hordeum vulgare]KAI4978683.1 hypothetical protein ZWY2020_015436 [Hordeum vulgare]
MAKLTVALLLILCLLLATESRGRIIDDGGEKISLPYGLCVHDTRTFACKGDKPLCFCCRMGWDYCYETMEVCLTECVKRSAAPPPSAGGGGSTPPLA